MIGFRPMTLWERIKYLRPSYRKRKDAETYTAIKWLVDHPEAPCAIKGKRDWEVLEPKDLVIGK
jgi:hypothetical protein